MIRSHGGRRSIIQHIAADQASLYNVFTTIGSPSDIVDVLLIVDASVACKAGIDTGTGWVPGSTLTIQNLGFIAGAAGAGGSGESFTGASSTFPPQAGSAGSPALVLHIDTSIDNGSGFILGGGGGGGGGAAGSTAASGSYSSPSSACGGGGGGGRGYNNAAAGLGGPLNAFGTNGANGNAGSSATQGAGGSGGTAFGCNGGSGGNGGDFGHAGSSGGNGSGGGYAGSGAAGGAAGNAVTKNGFNVTWISGNDATHVNGAIV